MTYLGGLRPLAHSIMPMDLQAHFGLDFKAPTPEETDMFLREGALHCRSMIVVDSDLNNNPILQRAAEYEDGIFWHALRTGYLRRAARESANSQAVQSQSDVLEGLRRINKKRAADVPGGYVSRLDLTLARAEEINEPLIWRRSDVDKYSLSRLKLYLHTLEQGTPEPSDLIHAVLADVEQRIAEGSPFGAADIEARHLPEEATENDDWRHIWTAVTEAQSGNIPFVFKGNLAIGTAPGQRDRFLAAGPNSVGLEERVESQLYQPVAGANLAVQVEERQLGGKPEYTFEINRKKLAELRLEEIEDLREEALGGEFFQARFDANGCGTDMLEAAEPYAYTMNEYHDRLARAGILRTRRAERAAVTEALRRVVLTVEQEGKTREIIMRESYSRDYPLAPSNIVMCDSATIVDQLGEEGARRFGAPIDGKWTYRRPDYRILERLGYSSRPE